MEIKKSDKANLENFSKIFLLLGLVFALYVVYNGIEYKTVYEVADLGDGSAADELEEEIPIIEQQPEEVKPPPPPPPPAPEVIEVVEDEKEIEETVLKSTETDQEEEVEIPEEVEEEVVEEEQVVEEVPFALIEEAPTFPGCKGSKAEKKACFNKKIRKHIINKFNVDLAQDLGLSPGKKRIAVQFIIDEKGNIVDIKSRAPDPRLKKEAERVVRTLPKMSPAKQRNKAVKMRFNMPIVFEVLDD